MASRGNSRARRGGPSGLLMLAGAVGLAGASFVAGTIYGQLHPAPLSERFMVGGTAEPERTEGIAAPTPEEEFSFYARIPERADEGGAGRSTGPNELDRSEGEAGSRSEAVPNDGSRGPAPIGEPVAGDGTRTLGRDLPSRPEREPCDDCGDLGAGVPLSETPPSDGRSGDVGPLVAEEVSNAELTAEPGASSGGEGGAAPSEGGPPEGFEGGEGDESGGGDAAPQQVVRRTIRR